MKKVIFMLLAVVWITGCTHHHRHLSASHYHNQHHCESGKYYSRYCESPLQFNHQGHLRDNLIQQQNSDSMSAGDYQRGWTAPAHSYRPTYTHKLLSDYAEQMSMKLVENMRYVGANTPVAITSFVELDGSLGKTNILGNQLAESFITELQEFGIPVMDFKTTGVIHVGSQGDFAFSRNLGELKQNPVIKYVLSGTMTYNDRGVILNVRMVDLASKMVVASTKGFIPHFVVDSLYPSRLRDGLILDSTS